MHRPIYLDVHEPAESVSQSPGSPRRVYTSEKIRIQPEHSIPRLARAAAWPRGGRRTALPRKTARTSPSPLEVHAPTNQPMPLLPGAAAGGRAGDRRKASNVPRFLHPVFRARLGKLHRWFLRPPLGAFHKYFALFRITQDRPPTQCRWAPTAQPLSRDSGQAGLGT